MNISKSTALTSKVSLKESIATKLLKTGISLYLIATIILTACHMITEYSYVKKSVIKDLRSLEKTIGMGLSKLIWEMDKESLSAMVAGIYDSPVVVGLKIEINELNDIKIGAVIDKHNAFAFFNEQGEQAVSPGNISGLFGYEFPLVYKEDGEPFPVAKMVLFSSREVILDRVKVSFSFIIINALLITIFLCVIFYAIIQRLLARPLKLLTQAASSIDMDKLENIKVDIQTSGKTELKVLEDTFNRMIAKLYQNKITLQERAKALEEELSERMRAEKELQHYQANLEELVENRTRELNAALENFKESERRQSDIIDFLPDPTFVIDNQGVIIAWNKAMEELTGASRDDMLGKGNYEYALPFYHERRPVLVDLARNWDETIKSRYLELRKDGERLQMETFIPHMGEEGIYLAGAARVLFDADGNEMGAIESIRDITERKKVEAELQGKLQELERFNKITLDREMRMIELKKEINRLYEQSGGAKKYKIVS